MHRNEFTKFLEVGVGHDSHNFTLEELAELGESEDPEAALLAVAILANPRWCVQDEGILKECNERLADIITSKASSRVKSDALRLYATMPFYEHLLGNLHYKDIIDELAARYDAFFRATDDNIERGEEHVMLNEINWSDIVGMRSEFAVLCLANNLGILAVSANPWEATVLARRKKKLFLKSGQDVIFNPLSHTSVGAQVKASPNYPLEPRYTVQQWENMNRTRRVHAYMAKYGEIPIIFTDDTEVKPAIEELQAGSYGEGTMRFSRHIQELINDTPPNPQLGPTF